MQILIIGDRTNDLSDWASAKFSNCILLSDANFDYFKNNPGVYYTSLADTSVNNINNAIACSDRVIFKKPINWSSEILKDQTEYLLCRSNRSIENLLELDPDPLNLLQLIDLRKSSKPQLWIAGCSYADGYSVLKNQRYGQLVADATQLPVSFLTCPASSIEWAADQILRSNIRKNDIVVWGLTSINRRLTFKNFIQTHAFSGMFAKSNRLKALEMETTEDRKIVIDFFHSFHKLMSQLDSREQKLLEESLISEDRLLSAVKTSCQVINYCNQIGAKIILATHPLSIDNFENILVRHLALTNNYIHLSPEIDKGWDNSHPGIQTHANWALELLNFIKENKLI